MFYEIMKLQKKFFGINTISYKSILEIGINSILIVDVKNQENWKNRVKVADPK